jgi:hypothetical protein
MRREVRPAEAWGIPGVDVDIPPVERAKTGIVAAARNFR